MMNLEQAVEMALSNASAAIDQANEYDDSVASFRDNVIDTMTEHNVKDESVYNASLAAYDDYIATHSVRPVSTLPLKLRRENGKAITCDAPGGDRVALIVWSKSGAPKLPLDLTVSEATGLRTLLDRAIAKAA
jgi:hypothetical protein